MKRTRDEQNLRTSVRRQLKQSEPNRAIRLPLSSSFSMNVNVIVCRTPSSVEHRRTSSAVTLNTQSLSTIFVWEAPNRRAPSSSTEHYHRHHIPRTVVVSEEWASTSLRAEREDFVCVEWADTFIREAKNSRNSRGWSISVLVGRCRNIMKMLTTSTSTEWNRSNDYATTLWISTTEDRQRHYCYDEHYWRTLLLQRTFLLRYCAWMCMHTNITA